MEQPYDPSNFAEYSTNGHGTGVVEEYETHNEFGPLSSVLGDGGVGISALAFDTHEELLWMGNQVSLDDSFIMKMSHNHNLGWSRDLLLRDPAVKVHQLPGERQRGCAGPDHL